MAWGTVCDGFAVGRSEEDVDVLLLHDVDLSQVVDSISELALQN